LQRDIDRLDIHLNDHLAHFHRQTITNS
jgi:hypothetical protein